MSVCIWVFVGVFGRDSAGVRRTVESDRTGEMSVVDGKTEQEKLSFVSETKHLGKC